MAAAAATGSDAERKVAAGGGGEPVVVTVKDLDRVVPVDLFDQVGGISGKIR